jgi:phosphatidylinositol alpha-1,6-mannosyltransferase
MSARATPEGAESRATWWFVTRKYPPAVGGMERLSWEVTTRLARRRAVHVIAMSGAARLPGFIVASTARVVAGCIRHRVSLLHVGDPVLAPVAVVARAFGIPTAVTIHGLDVAYRNPVYRAYRRMFLRGFDVHVCISHAARQAAIQAGVPAERIQVIGIGIDAPVVADRRSREDDRLLFVGRLVARKGLAWFVGNVLSRIARARPALKLAILGDGPERAAIGRAAEAAGVVDRLIWLGAADDRAKAAEFARATLCVMPNVAIAGDVEGFGIVALEAAAAACPLLASRVDGLSDAVADGESGRLIAPEDASAWVAAIEHWLADSHARAEAGRRAQAHVIAGRGWDAIIDRYERVLTQVIRR